VCTPHACLCSTSSGAQQSAIPTDVVLTIRSAYQAYALSQLPSRARTVNYAYVMEQMSSTVLQSGFLSCHTYEVHACKHLTLLPTCCMKCTPLGVNVPCQQGCRTFAYVQSKLKITITQRVFTQRCMSACGCLVRTCLPLTRTSCRCTQPASDCNAPHNEAFVIAVFL
jgi:hypothetical protein